MNSILDSTPGHRLEIEFLLCSARTRLDKDLKDRLRSLGADNIDWEYLVQMATRHRVFPLLYKTISNTCPDLVPANVMEDLRYAYLVNTNRNIGLSEHLIKVIELFQDNSIFVIPFKGPLLADAIYGNLALRWFCDLDILINREKAIDAFNLLVSHNYRPEITISQNRLEAYTKTEYSLAFFNKVETSIQIELHWELTGIYSSRNLDLTYLAPRLVPHSFLNRKVHQLSSEDLLVYLCFHGEKDSWSCLDAICCVSETVNARQDMDWDLVLQLAKDLRCRRRLLLGLFLAGDLLDTNLPYPIKRYIEDEAGIPELASTTYDKIFKPRNGYEFDRIPTVFSFLHLKVKDSFSDKILQLLNYLFKPSRRDWEFLANLPFYCSFIRRMIRPLRLAGKFFYKLR